MGWLKLPTSTLPLSVVRLQVKFQIIHCCSPYINLQFVNAGNDNGANIYVPILTRYYVWPAVIAVILMAYNTLSSTMSPWTWYSLQCAPPVYTKLPCSNLRWSITQSFLLQICISLEAVLLVRHECTRKACSRVGTHSSELWTYTGNCVKSRGWALFVRVPCLIPLQHRKTSDKPLDTI